MVKLSFLHMHCMYSIPVILSCTINLPFKKHPVKCTTLFDEWIWIFAARFWYFSNSYWNVTLCLCIETICDTIWMTGKSSFSFSFHAGKCHCHYGSFLFFIIVQITNLCLNHFWHIVRILVHDLLIKWDDTLNFVWLFLETLWNVYTHS